MNKDNIFFGANGLTSTSANHVANMAKEAYQTTMEELDSIRLYDESISLLGQVGSTPISSGVNDEFIDTIPDLLKDVADLKSLIAWLREAIKARKALMQELEERTLVEWLGNMGIEVPKCPQMESIMDEDDYYGSLPINERLAYYTLETKCATLGKYIHECGKFSEARKKLNEIKANPSVVRDSGRDTTILTRTPSVDKEHVDKVFFELQAGHRECQASLNAIKHKCDLAIEQDRNTKRDRYNREYQAYSLRMQELANQFSAYKETQAQEIAKLKIVVPDNLKRIYDKVSGLGK